MSGRGDRGSCKGEEPYGEQRAIEGVGGRREGAEGHRRKERAVEGTESHKGDRGP